LANPGWHRFGVPARGGHRGGESGRRGARAGVVDPARADTATPRVRRRFAVGARVHAVQARFASEPDVVSASLARDVVPTGFSKRLSAPAARRTWMVLQEYVEFNRRLGNKVRWLDEIPFCEYRRMFYWSVPRHREYQLTATRLRSLLYRGAMGAIGMTGVESTRLTGILMSDGPGYGLGRIRPKKRSPVRRGLGHREVGGDAALIVQVSRELLESGRCRRVGFGSASNVPGLLHWKLQMGYRLQPIGYSVVANPLLKAAKFFSPKLRLWLDGNPRVGRDSQPQ